MVWKETTALGCGLRSCPGGITGFRAGSLVVCRWGGWFADVGATVRPQLLNVLGKQGRNLSYGCEIHYRSVTVRLAWQGSPHMGSGACHRTAQLACPASIHHHLARVLSHEHAKRMAWSCDKAWPS
jgi:hypothetical protein